LLFATALLLAAPLSHAQAPAEKLKKIEKEVEQRKARAAELAKQREDLAREMESLRGDLTNAATQVRAREQDLSEAERGLAQASEEEKQRSAALEHERANLAQLLLALTRVATVPTESLIAFPDAPIDSARAALLMRSAVPAIAERARSLNQELLRLADLRRGLDGKRREAQRAEQALKVQQASLGSLLEKRQQLAAKTEADRRAEEGRIASLSRDAKDLRDLMAKIEAEQKAEAARQAAAAKAAKAKGKAPPVDRETPTGPLVSSGAYPVAGTIRVRYGQTDDVGSAARGVTIATRAGATVTAPLAGRVRFAGLFRSYGRILILEHPGGYHSLIAGFGRVDAAVGAQVGAGEPVGIMPSDAGERPDLYFEFRRDGHPIDPQMATSVKGRSG
jgi:septal ring factor EnvC (AmiA/AmiB activator)